MSGPQLFSPAAHWPYTAADIQKDLPTTYTDEDFAIASWQFVIKHIFHYCSAGTQVGTQQLYAQDPSTDSQRIWFRLL